jgi:hypothetical protein
MNRTVSEDSYSSENLIKIFNVDSISDNNK